MKKHNGTLEGLQKLEDQFERDFPREITDPDSVEHVVIDKGRLAGIVMYLACMIIPDSNSYIPDEAAALFGSKRYGREALSLLEAEARSGGPYSKEAKKFRWLMKYYLKYVGRD